MPNVNKLLTVYYPFKNNKDCTDLSHDEISVVLPNTRKVDYDDVIFQIIILISDYDDNARV